VNVSGSSLKKSDSLTPLLDHRWTDVTPTQVCFLKSLKEQRNKTNQKSDIIMTQNLDT